MLIENWRPISLSVKVDIKVISQVIASRIKSVFPIHVYLSLQSNWLRQRSAYWLDCSKIDFWHHGFHRTEKYTWFDIFPFS